LHIPPLRERAEDIPLYVSAFIKEFSKQERKNVFIQDEVMQILCEYAWPGNVRQLRNVIERTVAFARGDAIKATDLPEELLKNQKKRLPQNVSEKPPSLKELEYEAVVNALKLCKGNKSKTAKLLGISRKALYKRIREYSIA
jgi:transcriptional regulator with PAS, ATPase and Fis domain